MIQFTVMEQYNKLIIALFLLVCIYIEQPKEKPSSALREKKQKKFVDEELKKNKMSSIHFKKFSLLFLIISAALFSTSFAGRVRKSVVSKAVSTSNEDSESWEAPRHDEESEIHDRVLKVRTNDYGRYDPAPAFVKPPFKLIPN